MDDRRKRLFATFAALAFVMCAFAAITIVDNDNEIEATTLDKSGSSITGTVGSSIDILVSNNIAAVNSQSAFNQYSITASDLPAGLSASLSYNSGAGTLYRMELYVRGTPTENASGTYSIDVTRSDTTYHVTGSISITGGSTLVTSITITGPSSAEVGDTLTYTASVSPSNASNKAVTWSISSGSSYATITSQNDSSCTVKANSAGTITVKATADDGSGKTATKSTTITAADVPVTSISVSASGEGDSVRLTATVSPSNATNTNVTWSVYSGSGDVTLSSTSGSSIYVYPDGNGSVTIRATAQDGSGKYGSDTLYVFEMAFNANGGSGAPSSVLYIDYNSSSNRLEIPSTEPYRSGWEFMGWATSAYGSPSYSPGDTYSVSYSSVRTMYAIWGDYGYLSFNKNGGSGSVPSTQSVLIAEDDYDYITIPSSPTPTMSGMVFEGWCTNSSGTGTMYSPGDSVEVDCGQTVTLYAYFEDPYVTYTLQYDANGGSGAPVAQTAESTSGSYTFTVSSQEPTRSGYVFMGWSTSGTSSGTVYHGGDRVTVTGTTTLRAVWEAAVIEITSSQQDVNIIVGQSFSYTVTTDVSGCTVSVSGASWLTVSGNNVFGNPVQPGEYTVTITASKAGYTSATQTFTITVSSALGFTSQPSTGVIAYAV